jgi:ubiquinone/menaquinone biosynthesis C-methylase UbiE
MSSKTNIKYREVDESLSSHFDKYMVKHESLYDDLSLIINSLCIVKHPLILDIGFGSGILLERLINFVPSALLVGIDPSDEMITIAKDRINGNESFSPLLLKAISESIPLRDECIDVVVSRFSLTYWKHTNQSLEEIMRVLKPKGYLILETLNRDFSKLKLLLIKMNMFFHNAKFDVVRYHADAYKIAFSSDEIMNLLSNHCFSIKEIRGKKKQWRSIFIAQKMNK